MVSAKADVHPPARTSPVTRPAESRAESRAKGRAKSRAASPAVLAAVARPAAPSMHARSLRPLMTQTAPTPAPPAPCGGCSTDTRTHPPAKRAKPRTRNDQLKLRAAKGKPSAWGRNAEIRPLAHKRHRYDISLDFRHKLAGNRTGTAVPRRTDLPQVADPAAVTMPVRRRRLEERRIRAVREPRPRRSDGRPGGFRPGGTASPCRPGRRDKYRPAGPAASTGRHRIAA